MDHSPSIEDRRADIRLAGGGQVDAVVVDRFDQPLAVLDAPRVLNVSAGGLALASRTAVRPGAVIRITVNGAMSADHANRVRLQAIECAAQSDRSQRIRCRLIQGAMPASLIYNW